MATKTQKAYHHGNLRAELLQRAAEIIDADGVEALTLRGLARDLQVSHAAPNRHFKNKAALLSALATDGWLKIKAATLDAADQAANQDAHSRLNAMGRGYLRWALNHRPLFRTLHHPDVNRYADQALKDAIEDFSQVVTEAVAATQIAGRHPDVPVDLLTLYTNAVPTGAALLLVDSMLAADTFAAQDQEALIAQVINLVVPLPATAN